MHWLGVRAGGWQGDLGVTLSIRQAQELYGNMLAGGQGRGLLGVGGCWGQGDHGVTLSLWQAQELYGDALAGGQSSFLLQQEGTWGDVFSCSLGDLPPGEEAALTLHYVCELPLEPDGAACYVLPAVLRPRYVPHVGRGGCHPGGPASPPGELPYTLSLSATLQSPHGIDRVLCNCPLTPLTYMAGNRTTAQVSLAEAPPWDRDVELLVYYVEPHKPSAVLEVGLPGAEPGSLMGDPAVMVTLLPSLPEAVPGQSPAGEFIFLLDRSGSMGCPMDSRDRAPLRIDSAKETLVLLLKSLPLGCYFNIYGFGSRFQSFYPQSVGYTQQTMAESLQRVQQIQADLGGTEILAPLRAIYRSPCRDGHPRQLFVFTDGEVGNIQDVITKVQRHREAHRCFYFGIGEGASMALIKGIARTAGGSADGASSMPSSAGSPRGESNPPPPHRTPPGLVPPDTAVGGVTLQYRIQDQTYKETLQFPLQPQDGDSQVAAAGPGGGRGGQAGGGPAPGLSSGVVCSLTAYVGVDTERGQPVQGPLVIQDIPLPEIDLMAGRLQYSAPHTFARVTRLGEGNQRCASLILRKVVAASSSQNPAPALASLRSACPGSATSQSSSRGVPDTRAASPANTVPRWRPRPRKTRS
ncbi:nuclear factor related to kappa-B-binding protein [Platysternon megacephalum]|uniref:Nuclear factor related to kappa-B-binding protein n=1 Tax=Platysternon megacephalum TaxID=55544 RepID=A0A4D9DJE4_9SAUR|nr:nuclear factor related to kappa-B-binding protein [Platysternon megacephalum]